MGGNQSSREPNNEETSYQDVAIIGGGIAGLITAYYLSEKGIQVSVFETSNEIDSEITNNGPAAVTMWNTLPIDGTKDFDADAGGGAQGLFRFVQNMVTFGCNSSIEEEQYHKLNIECKNNYQTFLEENPDAEEYILNQDGIIYILHKNYWYKNKKLYGEAKNMKFYTKHEFEKSDIYDPQIFDGMKYYGAIHVKDESSFDIQKLIEYLTEKVEGNDGEIKKGVTIARINENSDGVEIFLDDDDDDEAQHFDGCVVANGIFARKLLKDSGFNDNIPEIFGVKGYSITAKMPEDSLRRGIVDGRYAKFGRPFIDNNGVFCIRFGGFLSDPYHDEKEDKIDSLNNKTMLLARIKKIVEKNDIMKKIFETNEWPSVSADTHDGIIASVDDGNSKVEIWSGTTSVSKTNHPIVRKIYGSSRCVYVGGFGVNGFVMGWNAGPNASDMFELESI